MGVSNRLLTTLIGGLALALSAPLVAETSPLEGLWYGEPEHDGRLGHIALRVETDGEDRTIARLSLLDIDVRDLPIGVVRQEGDEVSIGPLSALLDAEAGTLSGILPDAIVPVHSIAFTLRRVEALPTLESGSPDAPAKRPRWAFDAGTAVWGGLAERGGRVAFGTDAGELILLDAKSGEVEWRHAANGAIRSRPAFVGDDIVVASDDGVVFRLDASDGSVRWAAKIGEPQVRLAPGSDAYRYDNYGSSPVVHDDVLYVGSGNDLVALDVTTGEVRWRFATGDTVSTTPAVSGGRVFVGSYDGKLYSIDASTGAEAWSHDFGAPVTSSPAVANGRVVAGSRSYDLTAFDAGSGKKVWSHYEWFSWLESSPVVRQGTVYVGSSDAQKLRAFDAAAGDERWTFDTGGSAWAQPAVSDERVYIGSVGVANYSVDHRATFWAIDRKSGRAAWRFDLQQPEGENMWGFAASPVVDSQSVYAATISGHVYAFGK